MEMILKVNGQFCSSVDDARNVASPLFANFVEEWLSDDKCILAHTSGSTGVPKEIYLDKNDVIHSALLTNEFFGINENSRMLLCLSPNYIAGKMMIVRALIAHAEIVEEKPSNQPLSDYEGENFDFAAVVPSQALWLVNHLDKLSKIKKMIIGGGVVSEDLRLRLSKTTVDAYSTYGMTETCSHVALSRITDSLNPFVAMPGIRFEQDDRGCLIINSDAFTNNHLVTNDIVNLLSPEKFIWLGRFDNVINSGGIKIFPEDVERALEGAFDCRYYISSEQSEKWGQSVVLVLERKGITEDESNKIMNILKEKLPKYSVPKRIICMERFDETSSGKVVRQRF